VVNPALRGSSMRARVAVAARGFAFALAAGAASVHAEPAAAAREFRDCSDCPVMIPIEPGTFMRGSTAEQAAREQTPERDAGNERPQGRVEIRRRFALGKFEVTRGQFAQFARETRLAPSTECLSWDRSNARWGRFPGERNWIAPGFEQGDDHPVVCVSWSESKAYAAWVASRTGKSYRLATDAEWEYAARAGTATQRWWGDDRQRACEYANVSDLTKAEALRQPLVPAEVFPCRDGHVFTAPVGRFKPNPWGLYDLFGNAWEWTEDCFGRSYDGAPTDGSARQPAPGTACGERVMRGGAWHANPFYIRAAKHDFAPPSLRSARMGLRLARDLP
jgi:formylglycine-generating enzyme required for sulfatase activity